MARTRQRRAERKTANAVLLEREAEGDRAVERYAYVEAGAAFERALANATAIEDKVRLSEKIGLSLFYGARPDTATPWFEQALALCKEEISSHHNAALSEKVPVLLRRLVTQAWLEGQTPKALELNFLARDAVLQGMDSTTEDFKAALQRCNLDIAAYLIQLGRYDEAKKYAGEAVVRYACESPASYAGNLEVHASLHAVFGNANESFGYSERTAEIARQISDGYLATTTWSQYANCALELGRIDIARSCRAKALLVAQERRILWRIPFLTLRFAQTMLMAGEYEHTRDLISDVFTFDTTVPTIFMLRVEVASELARALNDASLLARVFDDRVVEMAFDSEEPARFAPLAATYAKIYAERGQKSQAGRILRKALYMLRFSDYAGDLLALCARYCTPEEAMRARDLLVARTSLPNSSVAEAFLLVWEMNDALRKRDRLKADTKREEAVNRFARLGLRHFQNQLEPTRKRHEILADTAARTSILSDLQYTLSAREQEVAILVLRGLTNRAIAQSLHITENTVESHMTSILNRLGLQSRWQLRELSG